MSTAPAALDGAIRAVTRRIDPPDDVLDALGDDGVAWIHEGASFVTSGVIARVAPHDATALLASIDHEADPGLPGIGPLAVGALPFDREATGELLVPATITGRTADGRGWRTELGSHLHGSHLEVTPTPVEAPTSFEVHPGSTREQWRAAVLEALDAIGRGELAKVVLARTVTVDADRPFDRRTILARLREQQPGCFVYAASGLVGASPELLLARSGSTIVSRPLAGTTTIGDDAVEALLGSTKNMREHRLAAEAIRGALEPWCDHLDAPSTPEIDMFADVAHLATPIYGTLREPVPDVVTLVHALHPTPTVGGIPTVAALRMIARLEPEPRGLYAGPVGWVDARGDGEWVIALRGAAIAGAHARLHAGAGIVTGSDPDAEWEETQMKLLPMLNALVRP